MDTVTDTKQAYPQDDKVTLGDKAVETSMFDRYKGRKNVTDRVAILSSTLIRSFCYYHNKKLFRAPLEEDVLKMCRDQLGEPQQRFGLTLFQYTTDDTGALLVPEKCAGKVKLWAITESRYEELTGLNRSWPLMDLGFDQKQVDLQIRCTEEQYQRMTLTPMPEAHWKKKQSWYEALKTKEKLALEKLRLALGRRLPREEVMAILGASSAGGSPTGSAANAGDIDLSDVIGDED